jgi:hypothetical protein
VRLEAAALSILVAVLLTACAASDQEDAVAGRLEELRAARARLADARTGLAAAEAGGSGAAGSRGRVADARAAFERAYHRYQSLLAAFLETALTERPRAASTRAALSWYTDEAVINARETLARGGDPAKVESSLGTVARYHHLAGVAPPPALARARAEAHRAARGPAAPTAPPVGP